MARCDLTAQHSDASSSDDAGFVLLEVVVAFIIAALSLGVLYQAALTGLHATRNAARYEQALSRARSRLVIAEHGSPLVAGDVRGDDGGGFHWRLHVTPIDHATVRPFNPVGLRHDPDFQLTLYAVSVWVSWDDFGTERSVRLDTQQIGQAAR
ncbi:MAG TPA: pseudopilin I [Acetobacteraceae bacterium]|nr:pseudopilin I [Acetobacteraceae bacterium]